MAIVAAVSWLSTPYGAGAQDTVPHVEACTDWDDVGGRFGTMNKCAGPIVIKFLAHRSNNLVEAVVLSGTRFDSGANSDDLVDGWLFTACPSGYVPTVPFAPGNGDLILRSLYECVPQGRPAT